MEVVLVSPLSFIFCIVLPFVENSTSWETVIIELCAHPSPLQASAAIIINMYSIFCFIVVEWIVLLVVIVLLVILVSLVILVKLSAVLSADDGDDFSSDGVGGEGDDVVGA